MKESEFYAWLKARLPGMVLRIENAIGSGIPDMVVLYEGQTYWMELKVGKHALLRPYQLSTISLMAKQGALVFVVHLPNDGPILIYGWPFVTKFTGKYHKVVSESCAVIYRAFAPYDFSSVLKKLSKV